MKKIFISIWKAIKSFLFLSNSCKDTETTKGLRKLGNSCALTALSRVLPQLTYSEIEEAFYNCCDKWPSAGVTHKEFNIVLRHLGVFDKFTYKEVNYLYFNYFTDKRQTNILLIPGHYTVCQNGKIYDSYGYKNLPTNTKIYCYWSLKQ